MIKTCALCRQEKPLDQFHRQPSGKFGRHSYCAECANQKQRESRERNHSPSQRRKWTLKARYGITEADYDAMLSSQGGRCAICQEIPARPCIDHNHETGKVRGILCHFCNIRLPAIEDVSYRLPAQRYLSDWAANDNRPTRRKDAV